MGPVYTKDPEREKLVLTGYTDANFNKDGCSQSGNVFHLGGAAHLVGEQEAEAPPHVIH